MVVAIFLLTDKANWVRFFVETFLVANVSPEIVLEILFFTLSDANIDFLDRERKWKTYTIYEVFLTTRSIELKGKKEFAAVVLDPKHETFVFYIASLNCTLLNIYPSRRTQISGLITKEVSTEVPDKYVNFADVFFLDLTSKFPKHTLINDQAMTVSNHPINLSTA